MKSTDSMSAPASQPAHSLENSPRMLVVHFSHAISLPLSLSLVLYHSFACFYQTTLLPMHINFAIENRQLKCTPAFINQMCTHETVQLKSRWQFEVHCINWHQYNTLAMYRICCVHVRNSKQQFSYETCTQIQCPYSGGVDWLLFLHLCSLLLSLVSYSSIRPLRADRKLSIKCFIIMRCSLNFCPSPFGLRNYMLAVVLLLLLL